METPSSWETGSETPTDLGAREELRSSCRSTASTSPPSSMASRIAVSSLRASGILLRDYLPIQASYMARYSLPS